MTQRTIESILREFDVLFDVDEQTYPLIKRFIRTTLETERRQADERLREVVVSILAKRNVDVVYASDIKTIAEAHNIDITPNTPQV